ncbi:hypothetical protein [Comamonas antarctica]|uniref:Uncharacterized protein n=1 Tax=Comamonas antarctica TaxID=2743470 RepID=A0A6N1X3Z4_9BURK|nr:hypothetical protein [Comamonas antarctica]QKV52616.1 hypothetical protein HUK68_06705 [Comamonas antarctica]
MQRVPFLSVKPLSSVTPAMKEVQEDIEKLYRGLMEPEALAQAGVEDVIRKIRQLEQQLIEMRTSQAGVLPEDLRLER